MFHSSRSLIYFTCLSFWSSRSFPRLDRTSKFFCGSFNLSPKSSFSYKDITMILWEKQTKKSKYYRCKNIYGIFKGAEKYGASLQMQNTFPTSILARQREFNVRREISYLQAATYHFDCYLSAQHKMRKFQWFLRNPNICWCLKLVWRLSTVTFKNVSHHFANN